MESEVEVARAVRFGSLYSGLHASIQALRNDHSRVASSRRIVDTALEGGEPYYGINTGFGALANQRISDGDLEQLQRNLILSHAVGVGEPVPKEITHLMLRLKIHSLGLGYSGVSVSTLERLLYFDEHGLIPVVPSRGSVGASGDLAPLAHLALPLLGYGSFWPADAEEAVRDPTSKSAAHRKGLSIARRLTDGGAERSAMDVLREHGLNPLRLHPKDGLSLINGTQLMSAYGAYVLEEALRLERMADLLASMSLEALQGSVKPFDPRIAAVRPHAGASVVAANVRTMLTGSEILESHRHCGKVQDPYCLRCVPQVHGASRDALAHARDVVEIEINSATDNPLVFENGDIISGGNFHGQPLALALDYAAMALAELASISERRIYLLLGGHDGLPTLLMKKTGINSGFMIPQYTAAALVSENKVLAHPASVDSIPTSLGQEDHVSMGSISALKLLTVLQNVEHVFAIELFTAAQALDYRLPLRPGRGIEIAHTFVRERIPHREADYYFKEDVAACLEVIRDDAVLQAIDEGVGQVR